MWSAGSKAPPGYILADRRASSGRLFFISRDGDQYTLHCLNIEGGETAVRIPYRTRSPQIRGCLPPFLYYKYEAKLDKEGGSLARIIGRWNVETNKTEVLADSRRKPATNPLEEEGIETTEWVHLPNGDDGVLARCWPNRNLYKIAKTGEVSLFKSWDSEHPPKDEWLLECIKESFRPGNPRYAHDTQKKLEEFVISDAFWFSRLFASAPFSPETYGLIKPVFPQVLQRSPVALCSFNCFEMGNVRGAISIGREMGTPGRSRTDLLFFEPDGIKSVPLRFQMDPGDLDRLRQFLRVERNWGDAAKDFTPNPRVLNSSGWCPSDFACVVSETLCISNNNAEFLWFLSKEEILEARKRAKKIDSCTILPPPK